MIGLTRDDVPVAMEGDGLEVRMTEVGDMTVGFLRLPKGADLASALKGMPDDMCPCPHYGYVLRGSIRMRSKDGEQTFRAGQAYYWAPGHVPEPLEDSELVEFSPTAEFREVIAHLAQAAG
ncbi:hypothetical protein [Streptomyces sp. enrichment culture]|uniref:hypothetical protein n=1 Tax=Streptomyces sp. enrichment culture TaxID=1795815 RepID=UPI003F56108D